MKVLVVDDEPLARRKLIRMLEEIADVSVVGEAEDAETALAVIEREGPDLVLLDIQMRGLSGLELAAARKDLPPIVFTTAYDRHAVEAFEVSATDFLLKPIAPGRLAAAIEKVKHQNELRERADLRGILDNLRRTDAASPVKLHARIGSTTHLIDAREVTRIYASSKYALFRYRGREYLLDESLQSLEERLRDLGFFRVHRGELIQLKHVRALHSEDAATSVELSDGQRASVSRRSVSALKERLGIR